jgi:hypothetical protein
MYVICSVEYFRADFAFNPSPPKLTSVVIADEVAPDQIAIWRTQ